MISDNNSPDILIILESIHHIFKMEDELERKKIPYRIVNKPRSISTDCGVAIRSKYCYLSVIQEIAVEHNCMIAAIYLDQNQSWSLIGAG